MASPDGLRLCLGRHAPSDVLDLVFQYGFHLWLARPLNVTTRIITPGGGEWTSWGSRRVVSASQLRAGTCILVDHNRCWRGIFFPNIDPPLPRDKALRAPR